MDNSLVHYATGQIVPGKNERGIGRAARNIYDEARLQALESDGRMALASHIMQGMAKLDQQRKALCSPEDTALHNLLCEIEFEAFTQARDIQKRNRPVQAPGPWDF